MITKLGLVFIFLTFHCVILKILQLHVNTYKCTSDMLNMNKLFLFLWLRILSSAVTSLTNYFELNLFCETIISYDFFQNAHWFTQTYYTKLSEYFVGLNWSFNFLLPVKSSKKYSTVINYWFLRIIQIIIFLSCPLLFLFSLTALSNSGIFWTIFQRTYLKSRQLIFIPPNYSQCFERLLRIN